MKPFANNIYIVFDFCVIQGKCSFHEGKTKKVEQTFQDKHTWIRTIFLIRIRIWHLREYGSATLISPNQGK
jgi:hypothetical protein